MLPRPGVVGPCVHAPRQGLVAGGEGPGSGSLGLCDPGGQQPDVGLQVPRWKCRPPAGMSPMGGTCLQVQSAQFSLPRQEEVGKERRKGRRKRVLSDFSKRSRGSKGATWEKPKVSAHLEEETALQCSVEEKPLNQKQITSGGGSF